jgi:hypothetical protein
MNIDGEMLPIPPVVIKPARLLQEVRITTEDAAILTTITRRIAKGWDGKVYREFPWEGHFSAMRADDKVMLTRTMCPEAKPAVKDLAVFLKFSQ